MREKVARLVVFFVTDLMHIISIGIPIWGKHARRNMGVGGSEEFDIYACDYQFSAVAVHFGFAHII